MHLALGAGAVGLGAAALRNRNKEASLDEIIAEKRAGFMNAAGKFVTKSLGAVKSGLNTSLSAAKNVSGSIKNVAGDAIKNPKTTMGRVGAAATLAIATPTALLAPKTASSIDEVIRCRRS
jgi:hypothetical protein